MLKTQKKYKCNYHNVIDRYQSGYDVFLPANSTMNETPFKDPKNTSALVKDNGLPYEQFREVVNFQHPGWWNIRR